MCGIAAIFSRQAPSLPPRSSAPPGSLYHRGPDGQRHWMSADGRVALGHARLSIIDLATGDQPIASEDERTRIIVNGEFYDFEAIQRRARASRPPPAHAIGQRDRAAPVRGPRPAVPASAARRVRVRALGRAQPHDVRRRAIGSASSRCSTRCTTARCIFASEVKALFAAGVPARWDADAVSHSIEFGGHQIRTLFDGVLQVPPGHYLIATDRHIQLHQYWDFNYPRGSGRPSAPCGCRVRRGVSRMRSRRRCGCDCAPTCRSAAT